MLFLIILVPGDFSGGSVVENLPANAGDVGSVPYLEKSHMLLGNLACAPQLLSPCTATSEGCAPWSPCPATREATTLQFESRVAPTCHNERNPACSSEDPAQPKMNKFLKT